MSPPNSNICIVLPGSGPAEYSQTFIRAHIERLSAIVSYLDRFPVNTADATSTQVHYDNRKKLKQNAKVFLHRYVLNPTKKSLFTKLFQNS